MGRLEKYGVCALLFVIVTVLAVSIWGPRPKKAAAIGGADQRTVAAPKFPGAASGARPLGESPSVAGEAEKGGLASPSPLLPPAAASGSPFDRPGIPVPGSAKPAEPALPVPGKAVRYVVRQGETLDVIAKRELGSSARWEEILKWNEGLDPKRIRAGQEILLPPGRLAAAAPPLSGATPPQESPSPASAAPLSTASLPVAKAPSPSGAGKADRTHRVAKGETLYAISQRYYGKGARYRDILEANRGVLSTERELRAGMTLVIP
ncbi:MAG TPA: LysM peptidoglycan-binding domain-containing protein [Planctomycetota bacterium]|jgi:nucleoid-associated protein YgaU|nr:LysM peptidoglycan-binding domain-containing protein [Planctomycetota bacterium]